MSEEEDIVFVTCNGVTHRFVIEDMEPDFLQATFELLEAPTTLFSVSSNLAIPLAKKTKRLTPGGSYYIKYKTKFDNFVETDSSDSISRERKSNNYPHNDTELILNSFIASTAIYHRFDGDELPDSGECEKYLIEQLNNHNFDYIVRNRFGANQFLIAKVGSNHALYLKI